jgi:Leucine-rich repeat (LRR) protein
MNKEIRKLPNISKFKKLDQLIITNAKLGEIHPSIGNITNLNMLVLTNNQVNKLPKEIGYLKNLEFLNIKGNKDIEIPEEISMLDKSKGGSLFRIVVNAEDIGERKYNRLKELLPTTNFS